MHTLAASVDTLLKFKFLTCLTQVHQTLQFFKSYQIFGGFLFGVVASVVKKKIENKETLFNKWTFTLRLGF